MSRPMWFVKLLKHYYKDRYKIAGWTKKSRLMKNIVDNMLFKDDYIIYLPMDDVVEDQWSGQEAVEQFVEMAQVPQEQMAAVGEAAGGEQVPVNESIEINAKLEDREDIVLPSQVLEHFIEKANYIWVMDECICRSSTQCENYPIDLGCIFMGEAVLKINPKLGRLVSKDEARAHAKRARDEGLVQLVGRNKLDVQWMGVGPGSKLLTVCNCCECCCLYKVRPYLHEDIGSKIKIMPGVSVEITDACVGCGACADGICFQDALSVVDGRAVIDNERCVGCGRCVDHCPEHAIDLHVNDKEYVDNAIKKISSMVDVT